MLSIDVWSVYAFLDIETNSMGKMSHRGRSGTQPAVNKVLYIPLHQADKHWQGVKLSMKNIFMLIDITPPIVYIILLVLPGEYYGLVSA